jgi:hypothetical protein
MAGSEGFHIQIPNLKLSTVRNAEATRGHSEKRFAGNATTAHIVQEEIKR